MTHDDEVFEIRVESALPSFDMRHMKMQVTPINVVYVLYDAIAKHLMVLCGA